MEPKIDYALLLDNEVPLMIEEFKDIARLYNSPPANQKSKVILYRRLLARLNAIEPRTDFLKNHRDLLKNSIRLFLGIKDRANTGLTQLLMSSPYDSVRADALSAMVSFYYNNGEISRIEQLLDISSNSNYIDQNQIAQLDVIVRSVKNNITEEEADLLIDIINKPQNIYSHKSFNTKLLNSIQSKLSTGSISKAINEAFYYNDLSLALGLIRLQIKKTNVDIPTLVSWGDQLGVYKKDMIDTLKLYQKKSQDYDLYMQDYNNQRKAYTRGRIYHRRLYAYRGESNAPYNVILAQRNLSEYLDGNVENKYLEENAKRAFRSFLAFKRYDLIKEFSTDIRSRMSNEVSPYISFWSAYALLQEGSTNESIPLLGEVIYTDPESYWGIVSMKILKVIFDSLAFSSTRYFNELKSKSSRSRQDLLNYAYFSYYMGGRFVKRQAESILVKEGLILPSQDTKISKDKEFLIKAYVKLNLTKNVRSEIYREGITNIYDQDALLFSMYQKDNDIKGILDILSRGNQILASKKSFSISSRAMQIYFPLPYQPEIDEALKTRPMDRYLLYSVMRVESFYKERAKSKAGARGLMQIMPVTGKWLVGRYLSGVSKYSLYEPGLNIYLGSLYLYENIDKFGLLPALAAYNSGPTYTRQIINKYLPTNDLEMVEIHPKSETRNYVRKVIESYNFYSMVYNNQPKPFAQI